MISSGSSQFGVWPQPGRTMKRLPGGRRSLLGGRTSRSSSPQAIVTGTVTASGSSKTWRRISALEAS